ncbi:condensation domain-containing protein, partial [Chryseobacterium cucumeris]
YYVELESLPLTPNGKVDRKSLPGISDSDVIRGEYFAPASAEEKKLVEIWQRILKVEGIGITDNFFELGGHSLIIGQVINQVFKELGQRLSFRDFFSSPTISGLCEKLKASDYVAIPLAEESLSYPLTSTQKQLWILSQFEGGSAAYNIPVALKIKGIIDIDKLEKSFNLLIERHEILRTSFNINEKGIVEQFVLNKNTVHSKIVRIDLTGELEIESKVLSYIYEKNNEAFDLQKGPLIKNSLIKVNDNEYILFFSMHHIIGDGRSLEIIVKDMLHFYKILINKSNNNIPDLKIQYKDFVLWKNSNREAYLKSKHYWLDKFSGTLPTLNIESTKKRPLIKSFNGNKIELQFSHEFTNNLKEFSRTQDVTLFMTLFSGVNVLLYTYSGQNDIIIGTPLAGRDHPDLENLVGLFLNILPIRTSIESDKTFYSLLQDQKNNLLNSFEHQNYPLNDLIDELHLSKDNSRAPLFDVMMSLNINNKNLDPDGFDEFEIEDFEFKRKVSQFDLNFVFSEYDNLGLTIEYNTDIFEEFEIKRMLKDFEKIMKITFDNPVITIKEFKESNQEIKKRNLNKLSNLLKK